MTKLKYQHIYSLYHTKVVHIAHTKLMTVVINHTYFCKVMINMVYTEVPWYRYICLCIPLYRIHSRGYELHIRNVGITATLQMWV